MLSCGVGNHVGLRGLPGGAEGIRTSDLRSAACASPPAAGSCSAASSTPFPRGSLAGGCGSASTRIGSSLPRRNPSPHPAARATRAGPRRPQPPGRRLPPCCHVIHSLAARRARREAPIPTRSCVAGFLFGQWRDERVPGSGEGGEWPERVGIGGPLASRRARRAASESMTWQHDGSRRRGG